MYVIVDAERMAVVAKVRDYKVAAILADMEYPNTPTHAFGIDGKRTFAKYTELELLLLARNGGLDPNILSPYGELLKVVYEMIEAMDTRPETYEQLEKKNGNRLLPTDDIRNVGKHPMPVITSGPSPERAPGEAAAAPAPRKAASAPRTPASKGATGKVHEICSAALAAAGGNVEMIQTKEFRNACKALCVNEGINEGTFGVQFGKWKSNQG